MLTYKQKFNRKIGMPLNTAHSISDLSKITGYSKTGLQKIFNKGVGAHRTNLLSVRLKDTFEKNVPAPASKKLGPEQWGMARVYSAIMGGPTIKFDKHLLKK